MTTKEALDVVSSALANVKQHDVVITIETDMLHEHILDSLDCLLLIMELDTMCSFPVGEDVNLVADGFYQVNKIVEHILKNNV